MINCPSFQRNCLRGKTLGSVLHASREADQPSALVVMTVSPWAYLLPNYDKKSISSSLENYFVNLLVLCTVHHIKNQFPILTTSRNTLHRSYLLLFQGTSPAPPPAGDPEVARQVNMVVRAG